MVRSRVARPAAPVTVLLTLTLTTSLYSCETESPVGEPTRETLPNGAVLARYPDLPAIDSVGAEVAEANVDLQFGSVDGADPNLTFGAIRVQAASDGTIYVLDQQAAEVRVFDSDGRYLRTIVLRGEGPGEIGGANGDLPLGGYPPVDQRHPTVDDHRCGYRRGRDSAVHQAGYERDEHLDGSVRRSRTLLEGSLPFGQRTGFPTPDGTDFVDRAALLQVL